jgi:hypothetical protein
LERQTARQEKDMAEAGWISGRATELGAWAAKAEETATKANEALKAAGAKGSAKLSEDLAGLQSVLRDLAAAHKDSEIWQLVCLAWVAHKEYPCQ